jgi:hypothetical protein
MGTYGWLIFCIHVKDHNTLCENITQNALQEKCGRLISPSTCENIPRRDTLGAIMRRFYLISTKLSGFIDHDTQMPSGWVVLWGMICSAILVLALPAFAVGAQEPHAIAPAKKCTHISRQDYINAHRCAQFFACPIPLK